MESILYLLNSYILGIRKNNIQNSKMQTQSSQMNGELKKMDIGETSYLNTTEILEDSEQFSLFGENISKKAHKKFSLLKQNKDGANAARTARITLMSMLLTLNKKGVIDALRRMKENINVKKLMLNIGQRQFKNRFLFKEELKVFFYHVFDNVSEEDVEQFLRKNKRSQLDYKERINLCFDYIRKYKSAFEEKFTKTRILIPIPLKPAEYKIYMDSQGFNFPFE